MERMFDILRSATQQKIGVEIKNNTIYYFYVKEILAKQTLVDTPKDKYEKWVSELYDGDKVVDTLEGTKEEVAKQCIQYSVKKKIEMENNKKFGTPSRLPT